MGSREKGVNLHIVRTAVSHDSRVQKESRTLARSGLFESVRVCGFHEPGYDERETLNGCDVWRVSLRTRPLPKDIASQAIKYAEWYSRIVSAYRREDISVIHCHSLGPLPIAVRLKRLTGARLVYDAHELESEVFGAKGFRKSLARRMEEAMVPSVDAIITVSPSIREWYSEKFPGIPVSVLRNIPERPDHPIAPQPLRRELGVPDDALLLIFIGGLNAGKGIEQALEAFEHESVRHHLLCLGRGPLKPLVEAASARCRRIHYLPPVRPAELVDCVAGADVSVCLTLDSCLSRRFSLPNKLFESLVAGVPLIVSPLPELSRMVSEHNAGWVVETEGGRLRELLNKLTVQSVREKESGLADRVSHLHWENEARSLLNVYDSLASER